MLNSVDLSASGFDFSNVADFGKMMRSLHGPQAVDSFLRQAVTTCWALLPEDKRTPENLDQEVRRRLDRVLAEFKDDAETFGFIKNP
mgnify:CR=1 FL=1